MKNTKYFFGIIGILMGSILWAQNPQTNQLLNIADLNPEIVEYTTFNKIEKENISLKRSRRDAHLLMVRFKIRCSQNGILALCSGSFATSFLYRSHPKIENSKAVGVISNSGEIKWISEDGQQQNYYLEEGEEVLINVIFEVPEETSNFEFHGLQLFGTIIEI